MAVLTNRKRLLPFICPCLQRELGTHIEAVLRELPLRVIVLLALPFGLIREIDYTRIRALGALDLDECVLR